MIEVFDNILSAEECDHIEQFLRDPKFPWFLSIGHNHCTTSLSDIEKNSNLQSGEALLLTHVFYLDKLKNSDNYLLSDFILNRFLDRSKIQFTELFRSKANLQPASHNAAQVYTTPHIDNTSNHKALIYYANDCDGDTFIFDDHKTGSVLEQISPKKGRFLLFDGNLYHAAGFPDKSDFRINVNFNLI
jgi:hypothetical protein